MNTKLVLSLFALVFAIFAISSVSAYTQYTPPQLPPAIAQHPIIPPTYTPPTYPVLGPRPNMTVSVDHTDIYYVNNGDTVELNFTVKNTGNKTGYTNIQFDDSDDDYRQYIEPDRLSRKVEVKPYSSETVRFKIYVNELPSDEYKVKFNTLSYYNDDGETYSLGTETKEITLHVDDYNPVDVSLDNDVICYNEEAPVVRHLRFSNDSPTDYYMKPKIKGNYDLWPSVKSDIITVPENKDLDNGPEVKIQFRKIPNIGTYTLKIEQDLYKDSIYSNPRSFEKTLTLHVENCKATKTSFIVNDQTAVLRQDDKVQVGFDFYNNSDVNQVVNLEGWSDDQTMSVVFPNNTVVVKPNSDYSDDFYVYTSENTSAGTKNITIRATTPYKTFTKTINVVVGRPSLEVTAEAVDIPVGLSGKQKIVVKNNSTTDVIAILAPKSSNADIIILSKPVLSLKAGESETVYAEITPKGVGVKSYTLSVTINGQDTDKLITYSSTSQVGLVKYIKSYPQSVNTVSGRASTIPVEVVNPNDSETTFTVKLVGNDITSTPSSVILKPNESKTVEVPYEVNGNSSKRIRATLGVYSNTGYNEQRPLDVVVSPDTFFTQALTMSKVPKTLNFIKGKNTETTIKIANPNDFEVTGATLKLLDADGNVLGQKVFNIPANETKDIKVTFKLNTDSDATGTIVLSANGSENSSDITYKRVSGFFKTGLFGLGVGGTISVILGAVIVVLVILYFSLRNPTKEVQ